MVRNKEMPVPTRFGAGLPSFARSPEKSLEPGADEHRVSRHLGARVHRISAWSLTVHGRILQSKQADPG